MKINYLSLNKNIFIQKVSHSNYFKAFLYDGKIVGSFKYKKYNNLIIFQPKFYIKTEKYIMESIQLLSEILYFVGFKKNDVICEGNKLNLSELGFIPCGKNQIKDIYQFEKERDSKCKNIDELYKYPYLVPWNLVKIELDVLSLVEKFVKKEQNILEIGSGYGKNLIALRKIGYKHITGVEISKNAYVQSTKFSYCAKHNINADISNIPLENNSIDCVIDIGCLHCADDLSRNKGLNEIVRVLKNGGLIISRFFLPKSQTWIERYPIKINEFGIEEKILNDIFTSKFLTIKSFIKNRCFYFIGEKK
ncbi:MAG: class I SAM-dependent methyltransferase [Clostridia bacterium]|nr:class I SAM-dependent methyltransferase [Clostridia bacterium]